MSLTTGNKTCNWTKTHGGVTPGTSNVGVSAVLGTGLLDEESYRRAEEHRKYAQQLMKTHPSTVSVDDLDETEELQNAPIRMGIYAFMVDGRRKCFGGDKNKKANSTSPLDTYF